MFLLRVVARPGGRVHPPRRGAQGRVNASWLAASRLCCRSAECAKTRQLFRGLIAESKFGVYFLLPSVGVRSTKMMHSAAVGTTLLAT